MDDINRTDGQTQLLGSSNDLEVRTGGNDQAFVYFNVTSLTDEGVDEGGLSAGTVSVTDTADSAGSTSTFSSNSGVTVFYFSVTDGDDDGIVTVDTASITGVNAGSASEASSLTYDYAATVGSSPSSDFDSSNGNAPGSSDQQTGSFAIASDAGSPNPSGDDTNFDNGGIVFVGQTASYDAADADDNSADGGYQLFEREDSDTGTPVRSLSVDSNGFVNVSTSGLDTGTTYYISNNNEPTTPSNADIRFTLRAMDFSADFAEDTVDNTGETEVDLELASTNRQSDFNVTVESDDLDDEELVQIFSEFGAFDADVDADGETDDEDGVELTVDNGEQELLTDFADIDGGEYNFTFSVTDTDAEADASITVNDVGEGELDLQNSTTTVTQGGVALITVELSDAATSGTLVIGDEAEDGYQANVSIVDDDDDGEVTVAFNTYRAGNGSLGSPVALAGDSAGEDSLTFDEQDDQTNLTNLLDSGDYIVSVSTSNASNTLDSPDNVGTLVLTEPEAPNQVLWRTSGAVLEDAEDADDEDRAAAIVSAVENEQVTQTDTLAVDPDGTNSDVLVHQLLRRVRDRHPRQQRRVR
ncbi:hypothetical protein ACFQRB_04940 [Halobaculum litoreum]|uniref:DUF7827 domain-containing protein n=1 Tax=Halobaculum litoreum TaxID=3031998 RepID=A0ABD5XLN3_9EURY